MLERIKAWLRMRSIVPKSYRCKNCTPFCRHLNHCLDVFNANMEEVKETIIERLKEVY